MRNSALLFFTSFCLCLSAMLHAQDKDDSKYLAGAVPEVNGKVVFTKEFSIPGMSQDEIFDRVFNWMDTRLKVNENNSRVVFSDKAKGQIVGMGDEWIVFSSSALSLDRTKILYQLTVICQPEKCVLEVENIRFNYREGKEKYTAEEWITDKYALNKAQTKLVRGLAKWRRKTVDFTDDLCLGVAEALSATTAQKNIEKPKEEKSITGSGLMVITPKQQITVEPKVQEAASAQQSQTATVVIPAIPLTSATVATSNEPVSQAASSTPAAPGKAQIYREITPDELPIDAIQTATGRLVIVIGEAPFNMTMMTANAGGSLGKVNGKPVIFSILSPDQPYEQIEKAKSYVVRFYPTGTTEPVIILECKKLPSPAAVKGMPRTYVGEILKAMVR